MKTDRTLIEFLEFRLVLEHSANAYTILLDLEHVWLLTLCFDFNLNLSLVRFTRFCTQLFIASSQQTVNEQPQFVSPL